MFGYKRKCNSILISAKNNSITLTNNDWDAILTAINGVGICSITGSQQVSQNFEAIIYAALPHAGCVPLNSSHIAYIVSILEHEGSIEPYHGTVRRGVAVAFHYRA